ncbi:MAG: hypothetical protein H6695_12080 [Deferribacteres bacterium]|nr:hypothetical protein [candidate division KSB1 bacterium]MCB9510919.1 hypothetical protein [Deferribacteres bacterium]
MDYGKKFVDALLRWELLAESRTDSATKAETFKKSYGGIHVEAAICDKDRYSFLFSGLRIESVAGNVSEQRLLVCANRLISTIDYLTENLALIEFDQQNGVVQIRSSKPVPKKDGYHYFEILFSNKNTCSVHRYQKLASEHSRRRIPVLMTRDTLERLIDDIIALWLSE